MAANSSASLKLMEKGFGAVDGQAGKVSSTLDDQAKKTAWLTNAYGLLIRAGQSLAGSLGSIAKNSVELAAGLETSRVSWGVLLGDMSKGQPMLDSLLKWSKETPYAFAAANQAAQTLKGFGIETEQLIPTMNVLGDIAKGNGQQFQQLALVFGQVKAQGKAMTQDLYQFVNAGVPIFDLLSKSMGVSSDQIKDLAAQSKITFPQIQKALQDATSAGGLFFGMMDKTAKTTAGMWSTAQDNFSQVLAELGSRILPIVNGQLKSFNDAFDGKDAVKQWADTVQNVVVVIGALTAGMVAFLVVNNWASIIQGVTVAMRALGAAAATTAASVGLATAALVLFGLEGNKVLNDEATQRFGEMAKQSGKTAEAVQEIAFHANLARKQLENWSLPFDRKTFEGMAKDWKLTNDQLAQVVLSSDKISPRIKEIAKGFVDTAAQAKRLADQQAATWAAMDDYWKKWQETHGKSAQVATDVERTLADSLSYQDYLVRKGLKSEQDALKDKISLRQKEIDSIEAAGDKTGVLTDQQIADLKRNSEAIKDYQARLDALKDSSASTQGPDIYAIIDLGRLRQILDDGTGLYRAFQQGILDTTSMTSSGISALFDSAATAGQKDFKTFDDQVKESTISFFVEATHSAKDWSKVVGQVGSSLKTIVGSGLEAVGASLVNANGAWDSYQMAAVGAIAKVLEALGEQLAIQAAAYAATGNWGAAATAAAASAAAFVASGAMSAIASGMGSMASNTSDAASQLKGLDEVLNTYISQMAFLEMVQRVSSGSYDDFRRGLAQIQITAIGTTKALKDMWTGALAPAYISLGYETLMADIDQAEASFYSKFSSMGSDISSALVDSLVNGFDNQSQFLSSIKETIRKDVIESAIYTDSLKNQLALVGTNIAAGIAKGFDEASLADVRAQLTAIYQTANTSAKSAAGILDSVFGDVSDAADTAASSVADFRQSLSSVGGDIASSIVDNLVNGLSGDDFLYALEQYITEAVVKAAVYTDSFMSQVSAIGTEIAAGISGGFTDDQLSSIKDRLKSLYEDAASAADIASSVVQSAFASYAVGTIDVRGDQFAKIHDSEMVLPSGIAEEARSAGIYIGPVQGPDAAGTGRTPDAIHLNQTMVGTLTVDGKALGQVVWQNIDRFYGDSYGL